MSEGISFNSLFQSIYKLFQEGDVSCLLIGGFAVNAYGVSRNTADIDFMVSEIDEARVRKLLKDNGYLEDVSNDFFSRFKKIGEEHIYLDILYIAEKTYGRIIKNGRAVTVANCPFTVPSLEHLIALKLHAIKSNPKRREMIDLLDIIQLVKNNSIDVFTEDFQKLCKDYGNEEIYQKIQKASE